MTKYYNNEIFGRNNIESKIIVLLRNDIAKQLRFNADTAKIFASYSVELNWFEEAYRLCEDKLKLKQFINKRIARNFEINHMEYLTNNPWGSFVDESEFENWSSNSKSSFKYVIDHTFYRPRDLILFFKDIDRLNLPLPISKANINILIGNYTNQMILEIQNELSALFSDNDITKILHVLKYFSDKTPFTYDDLSLKLEDYEIDIATEKIIEELFYYSLIGNINQSQNVFFKFRESGGDLCIINREQKIILHNILKIYFKNN